VVLHTCLTTNPASIGYRLQVAFQHVILALLEEGPSHGWQMKSRIEVAVGPEYGGLNRGYIYEVIHKMERDGLITSRVEPQAGPRPDRTVHEITDAGREQLTGWLAEPARPSAGFRDEFVQKVLAASMRGADELRRFCRLQRQALLAESKTLQTLRRERADDPAATFTIEVAILRTNAELECVEVAEARAGQRLVDPETPVAHADQYRPHDDSQVSPVRRRAGGRAGLLQAGVSVSARTYRVRAYTRHHYLSLQAAGMRRRSQVGSDSERSSIAPPAQSAPTITTAKSAHLRLPSASGPVLPEDTTSDGGRLTTAPGVVALLPGEGESEPVGAAAAEAVARGVLPAVAPEPAPVLLVPLPPEPLPPEPLPPESLPPDVLPPDVVAGAVEVPAGD
jgi:DNA-binding PadR family transcriptional regulator